MQNKLIEQKYSNDCGIAALAMLYEIPYSISRDIMLRMYPDFDGTTSSMAMRFAEEVGDPLKIWNITPRNRAKRTRDLMGRPAVLYVPAKGPPVGDWHAVYWTGREVLDPSPRGKYGRKGVKALKLATEAWVIASESSV